MESAIAEHGRIKALVGLRHGQGFARIAVMSDAVHARLIGRLASSPYAAREAGIDGLFSRHTPIQRLEDLREFNGWRGLAQRLGARHQQPELWIHAA